VVPLEDIHHLGEVEQRPAEAINLVDDDRVDLQVAHPTVENAARGG
jgi:hypothetical protein